MERKWFWLLFEKRSSEHGFAGALIENLPANHTDEAVREVGKLGMIPAGAVCHGGPLLASIRPPADYTGRLLGEAEALEAKALIEEQLNSGAGSG